MFGHRCDILAEFQETIAELKLHMILNSTLLGGVTYPKGMTSHMCLRWGDDGQKEFNGWMGTIALIYLLTRPVHSHEMLHVYLRFPNIGGAATNTCTDKLNSIQDVHGIIMSQISTHTCTQTNTISHILPVSQDASQTGLATFTLCCADSRLDLWQWCILKVGTIGQFLGNRQCWWGISEIVHIQ